MKISPIAKGDTSVKMSTSDSKKIQPRISQWWRSKSKDELTKSVIGTISFLKENQNSRARQIAAFSRLYGNQTLYGFAGVGIARLDQSTGLPYDRPTFNLIQSAADTLISRISQSRPSPVFLTDNGDYKERNLAKKLNNFIQGEFFHNKAYEKAAIALRDAMVTGTGCLHIYEGQDHKVALERVLITELFVDPSEAMYGEPKQLYRVKLIDRQTLAEMFPDHKAFVRDASQAFVNEDQGNETVSDLVMVVESWHLRSGPDATDGRHAIVCSSGVLLDEDYNKDKFPFVFLHYADRMLGFWGQGLAEQLMGTQMEINSLLMTISRSIKLVGVPRVFVEEGSKVTGAGFNNDVGTIIKYRGMKPLYEVAPSVHPELYAQLQRLIDYGYQQCGVSMLQASSQKPAGLNSGEAIRSYDDISTDRFASLARRYDTLFIDLAYQIVDLAQEIAERDGEYATVYPGKNGVKKIDLPEASMLKNPFVIQCFNMSSLPRDPAGRMQKITEMITSGMITIKEGRRLLDYPDLEQMEMLANASEERIFQALDQIVESGEYTPPDSYMDLNLAIEMAVAYYNLYASAKLEEEKCEQIRNFHKQALSLVQQATPPAPMPGMPGMEGMEPGGVPAPAVAPPMTQVGVNSAV